MRHLFKLTLIAGVLSAQAASAATFNVSLTADAGSRWYEYYSGVYAELGKVVPGNPDADGFFLIGTNTAIGSGATVFPAGDNFLNIGTLSYDAGTGAITGLTLDFDNYVADDDSVANVGYTTTLSDITGSVTLSGGLVSAINLTSDITFTYDTFLGEKAFSGSFSIANNRFTLDVDDTSDLFGQPYRLQWDVKGGVQGLAATAVPEPSTYALMGAGLLIIGAMARRKQRV